jgi:group II intron reverse transcriptase/maturase
MGKGGRWSRRQPEEVREMRNAETALTVIQDRGKRGLPIEGLYRQLFETDLYLVAYGRIYRNAGAMTRGITEETVDGMSMGKIGRLTDALRREEYRWTPVRRIHIEKKGSKKTRPLGIPCWSDKLLQEVIRLILEAYYEPQFSPASHGFRPKLGCHTALQEIRYSWTGTKWFIEGDIAKCFDSLDHEVMLSILREKIHDNRFLRLIEGLLRAGYLEEWRYNDTLCGSPQGAVLSPILANIYLDKLDQFIAGHLRPKYTRGTKRRTNPLYHRLRYKAKKLAGMGRMEEARYMRREAQRVPYVHPSDQGYRRLKYVRYADDWLLGFVGPRREAEEIKDAVAQFLREHLKLELSATKTLITHASTEAARFLGYEVQSAYNNRWLDDRGRRCVNGIVMLRVPADVIQAKCARYLKHGKPLHRAELTHDSPFSIVARYQQEYRGIVEYYRLALNLRKLTDLKWYMEKSLTQTLALKLSISVRAVYDRYRKVVDSGSGTTPVLEVTVERGEGKAPLVARWGGISLERDTRAEITEPTPIISRPRTELEQRLLADQCEICGATENIEVHHVRALKDLQIKGRREKPLWIRIMAARKRKTLVVCARCHDDIHAGRPTRAGATTGMTPLESRMR